LSDWSDEATRQELELGKQNGDTTVKYLSVYGALGLVQGKDLLSTTIVYSSCIFYPSKSQLSFKNIMI